MTCLIRLAASASSIPLTSATRRTPSPPPQLQTQLPPPPAPKLQPRGPRPSLLTRRNRVEPVCSIGQGPRRFGFSIKRASTPKWASTFCQSILEKSILPCIGFFPIQELRNHP